MPGLTGIQLQELLAATGRRMSIVFVSGHADVPTSVKAMKAGAVDLLTKPLDVTALIAAIQRAVRRDVHDRATEGRLAEIKRRVAMLTAREAEVFARVVTGMLNKQVAAALGIGEKTVKVPPRAGHGEDAGRIGRRAGPAGRRGRRDRTQDLIPPLLFLALIGLVLCRSTQAKKMSTGSPICR
jgi:FixJ family two-component response regulator